MAEVKYRKSYLLGDVKNRRTGVNNANRYKGNGRFAYTVGGMMFPRPLTGQEMQVESYLREKYGQYLADFRMLAGKNMGKPIWVLRFQDGREVDTYVGTHELEKELILFLNRNGVDTLEPKTEG